VAAAEAVVEDLIAAALRGKDNARLTDAPAGAGKTGAVVRLVGALAAADTHVGIVTQTNAQAFDVVERTARAHPGATVAFMPAGGVVLPASAASLPNVALVQPTTVHDATIVVATADKWAYSRETIMSIGRLDVGIVDEAYQMTSAKLLRIADIFPTLDLVGDPGQLDPFSTIDDEPWEGLPQNPVLNAVDALLAHHPRTPRRTLHVSRRLDWRATPPVREAFYAGMIFGPAAEAGTREIQLAPATGGRSDAVWDRAVADGWAYVELPERMSLQVDAELVEVVAELIRGLLARCPVVVDERTDTAGRTLAQDRVAVGVSHRNQRAAVTIALQQGGLGDVVVDTANRLQGREFDVVVALHPLSGRSDASAFHLDAGRLCVLATRHRQCCVLVGRKGAAQLLADYPPPGRAVLRVHKDPELDGWEAHARFLEHLARMRVTEGICALSRTRGKVSRSVLLECRGLEAEHTGILGYRPDDVVGCAARDAGLDFERDLDLRVHEGG